MIAPVLFLFRKIPILASKRRDKKIDRRWLSLAKDLQISKDYCIAAIWFSTALRMKAFIDTPVCFANAATRE